MPPVHSKPDGVRTRAMVAAVAAMCIRRKKILAYHMLTEEAKHARQKKRERQPVRWATHVQRLRPSEFKQRYRLTLEAFAALVELIRPHVRPKNGIKAWCSKPESLPIELEVQLAATIRWLAGGAIADIALVYNVEIPTMYRFVWDIVDAINAALVITFPLNDETALKALSDGFRGRDKRTGELKAPGWFYGMVGAIDGVHFAMKNPGTQVQNPQAYYVFRKDDYALLCIAICDANMKFIFADFRQSPTTHDSLAFRQTELGAQIGNGAMPWPFFLNGDSAFIAGANMVTPTGVDADFDFLQSSKRVIIERAFGLLVKRWGILWRPIEVLFARRIPLITACMKLHNFCVDHRVPEPAFREAAGRCEVQPDEWRTPPRVNENGGPLDMLWTQGHMADADMSRDKTPANYRRQNELLAALPSWYRRPYSKGKGPARSYPKKPKRRVFKAH